MIKRDINPSKLFLIFLAVVIYAIISMICSRKFFIPHFLHAANGVIPGDSQYYNNLAMHKTTEMLEHGITRFELRPDGQGSAGLGSLLYLTGEYTYSVVFFNALLHGASVVLMIKILLSWFAPRASVVATLPLAFSPYMIFWYSQLNKDSLVLFGTFCFIYGLLQILDEDWQQNISKKMILNLSIIILGVVSIWIVRPYVNLILLILSLAILIFFVLFFKRKMKSVFFAALMLILLIFFTEGGASSETIASFDAFDYTISEGAQGAVARECFLNLSADTWLFENKLPRYVNLKIKALMGERCLILSILDNPNNPTTIKSFLDADWYPRGTMDVLKYIPRASLNGIFSPWPSYWSNSINHPSVFYTIVPFEALLLYVGFFSLIYWIVLTKEWDILTPIFLSVGVMSVYGLAIPFLGALYRYRYPWWMLLLSLGVAASFDMLFSRGVHEHDAR